MATYNKLSSDIDRILNELRPTSILTGAKDDWEEQIARAHRKIDNAARYYDLTNDRDANAMVEKAHKKVDKLEKECRERLKTFKAQEGTPIGCLRKTVRILLIIAGLALLFFGNKNKIAETFSSNSTKVEQTAPANTKAQNPTETVATSVNSESNDTSEPVQSVMKENAVEEETLVPTTASIPAEEQVQNETSVDEEPALSKSEAKAKAKEEMKALEQKVTDLFNEGKAYCEEQDYNSAFTCLEEMFQIKLKLQKPNSKIDSKIEDLRKMLQNRGNN